MSIEYLLNRSPAWLAGNGPDADIVFSTRIRLARNLKGQKFTLRTPAEERRQRFQHIQDVARKCSGLSQPISVELEKISDLDRDFLVERRLCSPELSAVCQGGVIVGEREAVTLMVNEEDHLRIQALLPGLMLEECWRMVDLAETELGGELDFEFDSNLGFLTACPSNVGTGLRASVMLHLPILKMSGGIKQVFRAAKKLGLAIRGFYGEGSKASGNLYQFSNQVTLGCREKEIIVDLDRVIRKIVKNERAARRHLLSQDRLRVEDLVYRALGLLKAARLLNSNESVTAFSRLRIGVDLGILPASWREMVNELMVITQPAHLQKLAGEELSPEKRDVYRAELVRERLERKNN